MKVFVVLAALCFSQAFGIGWNEHQFDDVVAEPEITEEELIKDPRFLGLGTMVTCVMNNAPLVQKEVFAFPANVQQCLANPGDALPAPVAALVTDILTSVATIGGQVVQIQTNWFSAISVFPALQQNIMGTVAKAQTLLSNINQITNSPAATCVRTAINNLTSRFTSVTNCRV